MTPKNTYMRYDETEINWEHFASVLKYKKPKLIGLDLKTYNERCRLYEKLY